MYHPFRRLRCPTWGTSVLNHMGTLRLTQVRNMAMDHWWSIHIVIILSSCQSPPERQGPPSLWDQIRLWSQWWHSSAEGILGDRHWSTATSICGCTISRLLCSDKAFLCLFFLWCTSTEVGHSLSRRPLSPHFPQTVQPNHMDALMPPRLGNFFNVIFKVGRKKGFMVSWWDYFKEEIITLIYYWENHWSSLGKNEMRL